MGSGGKFLLLQKETVKTTIDRISYIYVTTDALKFTYLYYTGVVLANKSLQMPLQMCVMLV